MHILTVANFYKTNLPNFVQVVKGLVAPTSLRGKEALVVSIHLVSILASAVATVGSNNVFSNSRFDSRHHSAALTIPDQSSH